MISDDLIDTKILNRANILRSHLCTAVFDLFSFVFMISSNDYIIQIIIIKKDFKYKQRTSFQSKIQLAELLPCLTWNVLLEKISSFAFIEIVKFSD